MLHVTALDVGDADIRDPAAVSRVLRQANAERRDQLRGVHERRRRRVGRRRSDGDERHRAGHHRRRRAKRSARACCTSPPTTCSTGALTRRTPVDADVGPINVYGATKLEGERRVLAARGNAAVVRTAWVHSGVGANFVKTAVRVLGAGSPMRVVDDQIGTPTRARHLAQALWCLAGSPITGIAPFHRRRRRVVVRRRRRR